MTMLCSSHSASARAWPLPVPTWVDGTTMMPTLILLTNFMLSFPDIASASIFRDWPAPTPLRGPSRHRKKSTVWFAHSRKQSSLPENFILAYQRSGNSRYRDLAVRFIEQDYFGPLAEGMNVLPGEHAYSHVNAFSSAMQSYLVLGDEKYLRAARNGLQFVHEQSYAT